MHMGGEDSFQQAQIRLHEVLWNVRRPRIALAWRAAVPRERHEDVSHSQSFRETQRYDHVNSIILRCCKSAKVSRTSAASA